VFVAVDGVVACITYTTEKFREKIQSQIFYSWMSKNMAMLLNKSSKMGSPLLHEFKRQASFLKEKIKTARLALTDVTPTELTVR
jgi:hypothetical protein